MLSHWPYFTWKFFMIWLHKILKFIFQKQQSRRRIIYTEHWRKLSNLTAFSEIFLSLKNNDSAEQIKSFVNFAVHLFPRQNKVFTMYLVDLVVLNFYFDFALPFYFLKWNHYFTTTFFMSFLKAQVSFPSNFASIFSDIKHLLCTFLA